MDPMGYDHSISLPLLTLGSNNTEFDYAAYLQEEDIDYINDGGSSGSASVMNDFTPISLSPPTSATLKSHSSQKQRLERRGHTKSRRGCYNCKRRRIKCQETRPSCGHCVKTGLKCEYPAVPQITHQPQHQIPLFSLQDMRFFQHFLLNCTPHHPLGNNSIWTHEVPCLSQNHEYLMHAILGLAASDLMVQDGSLVTFAMAHRLKAIKAIKKTLTKVPKTNTFEEGNALLATCFALTFQSVMLDDGMAEFMTFCRGIVIVAIQMYCKGAKFIFSNFLGDGKTNQLQPLMEVIPPIQQNWTDMAVANIGVLRPLCEQQVEIEYHQHLTDIAQALYSSSFLAYQMLCKHYGWWMQISHENFQCLIDPTNQTCLLLASHWIALKQIMAVITETEYHQSPEQANRASGERDLGELRWLKHLNRQIDADHQQYNQWPTWVEAQLDMNLACFGKKSH